MTVATQTGCTPASQPPAAATTTVTTATGTAGAVTATGAGDALAADPHCYECRVRYRDPRPRDLVMYLHAWQYTVRVLHWLYSAGAKSWPP